MLQRVFQFRTCSLDIEAEDERWRWFRPCLLASIKQCTAPCNLRISKEEYRRDIARLKKFLDGNRKSLLKELEEPKMRETEQMVVAAVWRRPTPSLRIASGKYDSEIEISDAKAAIGRDGIGCEPASATTIAGLRRLIADGLASPDEDVVCVLTGHLLKDPDYTVEYHFGRLGLGKEYVNAPVRVPADLGEIVRVLGL